MTILFPGSVLKVHNTQVRLYSNFNSRILSVGDNPYISHTDMPSVSWVATTDDNVNPLIFRIQVYWLGKEFSEETMEVDLSNIINQKIVIPSYSRLQHINSSDSGGLYQIRVIATQGIASSILAGIFRVNFRPTTPIGLIVS